jgi:hypothetical protein
MFGTFRAINHIQARLLTSLADVNAVLLIVLDDEQTYFSRFLSYNPRSFAIPHRS